MYIDFEKWHGCQNDFIVTWVVSTDMDSVFETLKRLASKLCSRNGSGIAADGILILEVTTRRDIWPKELHIINSDGSLASNCGNGLRCAAMSVRKKALSTSSEMIDGVTFKVGSLSMDCRFVGREHQPLVAVTMPIPQVNQSNPWHAEVVSSFQKITEEMKKLRGDVYSVALGNPHIVAIVDEASEVAAAEVGAAMQSVRNRDGINVHLAHIEEITDKDRKQARSDFGEPIGELYKVWPWERGVGLTQACGSGACAVAVAAYESGGLERSEWVAIDMPGGRLYARQSEPKDVVVLTGPAVLVFEGRVDI
jgi:diaminopimelate epimerase